MNTPRWALVLGVALAGMAQAQSPAPRFDSGLIRQSGASMTIGNHDASTLGFNLGDTPANAPKAAFEFNIRYEPDSASQTLPQYLANADPTANPFAISGFIRPTAALKLIAAYADQDAGRAALANASTTAWVVGANYMAGASGRLLLGYGREVPEGVATTRLWSIGYEYPLSKRSWLYADATDKKAVATVRHLGIGIKAAF